MNKIEQYQHTLNTIKSVISDSDEAVSNMANFSAILMEQFKHHWIGFYLVDDTKNELYLGPFQGPLACTRIPYGKGVCGVCFEKAETIIVDNVHEFDGHIACSALSNSEIVVPVMKEGRVFAVLDIDSTSYSAFDETDSEFLTQMIQHLESTL